jgi:hypothetical protein
MSKQEQELAVLRKEFLMAVIDAAPILSRRDLEYYIFTLRGRVALARNPDLARTMRASLLEQFELDKGPAAGVTKIKRPRRKARS